MRTRGTINKLYPNGTVTTIRQNTWSYMSDGLAVDAQGNVYTTDKWLYEVDSPATKGAVYEIYPNGSTVTRGSGFEYPTEVEVDTQGNIYVMDGGVRVIRPDDSVEKLDFGTPAFAIDAHDNIYTVDKMGYGVNRISPDGQTTPVVSDISLVTGVAASPQGNVCVVDLHTIREFILASGGSAVSTPVYVGVDTIPPTISGSVNRTPSASGWYNTSVAVSFTASDSGSGLASATPGGVMSDEGANQSVVGTATDAAGNMAGVTVGNINIDKTGPDISIDMPPGNYTLNQPLTASWNWSDDLSGPAAGANTSGTLTLDTGSVGAHGFAVDAMDSAGNLAEKKAAYGVVYRYDAVVPPRYSLMNRYLGVMPIMFRLYDYNGIRISSATARLYLSNVTDGRGTEFPPMKNMSPSGDNQFACLERSGLYYYFLYPGALGRGTWQLRIELDDGTSEIYRVNIPG